MIGQQLGHYRILKELGRGGMGSVYAAVHDLLGKPAAIKVLLSHFTTDEEMIKRFFNEARAAAVIQHPGIVEVFEFGHHTDGSAYIVMELLQGESLRSKLRREGRLPAPLVEVLTTQIALALAAAHRKGVVHRDLKPDNIFLCPDEAVPCGLRVKVLDFGIAKLAPELTLETLKTITGTIFGTPMYMSPEQLRSASHADHRADIYSLGCIVFEMATGRPPFQAEAMADLIAAHLGSEPPGPRTLVATLPSRLESTILRALRKSTSERHQSMDELLGELEGKRQVIDSQRGVGGAPVQAYDTTAHPGEVKRVSAMATTAPGTPMPEEGGPSTTLSRMASEISPLVPGGPRPRSPWLMRGVVGTVLVLAGSGLFLLGRDNRLAPATPVPPSPPAAARAAAPAPAPAADLGTTTAGLATVEHRLESEPTGADVYRFVDGVLLGRTPHVLNLNRGAGKLVLVLKLAGHQDQRVELALEVAETRRVTLPPLPEAAPEVTPPPAPAAPEGRPRPQGPRRKRVGDGTVDPFRR